MLCSDWSIPVVHGGQGAGGELVSLQAAHDAHGLVGVAAPVQGAVPPIVLGPKVVADLMGHGVHREAVIVQVNFGPGCVTVLLADTIEVTKSLGAANISVQQQMREAVL